MVARIFRILYVRPWTVVLILAAAGLGIRLAWLSGGYTADEWMSVTYARLPWEEFWHTLRFENTPPLYFVILYGWHSLIPHTEAWMRVLSSLINVMTIPLFYRIARQVLTAKGALAASALFTLSAANLIESHDVRAYTLVILLAVLYLTALLRWIHYHHRYGLLWCALWGGLGLYAHLEFAVLLLGSGLGLLLVRPFGWKRLTASAIVVPMLLLIPWLAFVLPGRSQYVTSNVWMTHGAASRITQVGSWLESLFPVNSVKLMPVVLTALGTTWLILWIVLSRINRRPQPSTPERRLLITIVGVTFIAGLLTTIETPKYFVAAYVPLFVLLGSFWERTSPRILANAGLAGVLVVMALLVPFTLPGNTGSGWNSVAQYLDRHAQPTDVVIVHPFLDVGPLADYAQGPERFEGLLPYRYRSENRLEDFVKYNFQQIIRPDTVNDLERLIGSAPRVWYISVRRPERDFFNSDLPLAWFSAHGWQEQYQILRSTGDRFITLYTRGQT